MNLGKPIKMAHNRINSVGYDSIRNTNLNEASNNIEISIWIDVVEQIRDSIISKLTITIWI